jgi:hypothetical protein
MKSEILRVFKLARQSHLEWVVHGARLMVEIDESESKKPILYLPCTFSVWYEEEGRYITKLPGLKRIARFHEEFHQAYKALYYKKFDRRSSKKERKLFNKKFNKPSDSETTLRDKFEVLKLRYDTLEKEILALEKIVSIMNEKLFKKDRIRA